MLRIPVTYSCVLLLLAAAASAQPTIQQSGVVNAASNIPSTVPSGGIAPGSIFLVLGTGLGADNPTPMDLLANTTFPLPSSQGLNGTTVQVSIGGASVYGILLYESATQVAAILPSTTSTGRAQVTVTYNGQTSNAAPVQILERAIGIFSINRTGNGPGYILNYNSSTSLTLNRVSQSAQPGQTGILIATGIGAVKGDETQATYPGNMPIALDFQLYVGGKPASIDPSADYIGRDSCCGGVDDIAFQVPQGVAGCYVPVALIVNNVLSNTTTMSIAPGGGPCSDASPVGLSSDDLNTMITNDSARVGSITLTSVSGTVAAAGQTQQAQSDSGSAAFYNMTPQQFVGAAGTVPSPGGCLVLNYSGASPPAPAVGIALDAGPSININGPGGAQPLAQSNGAYTATFPAGYLQGGGYEGDDGGGGGDVGAFQANLNTPAPFTWTGGPAAGSQLSRSVPITFSWRGGDPNSLVTAIGVSLDPVNNVGVAFTCTSPPGAGSLPVPQYVLNALPANQVPIGILALSDVVQTRFTAPGLDVGYFSYATGSAVNVQWLGSTAKF